MLNCATLVGATVAAALAAAPVGANTVLRAFIPVSETRPEAKMFNEMFADKVSELSTGDLTIQTFYAGGLGFDVKDLLRHLKRGTVDIGNVLGAYYVRDAEELSLMLVDGAITQPDNIGSYRDIFRKTFSDSFARWDVVYVGSTQPLILDHSIFCNEPVTSLEELKHKKLRVWTKHQLESFQSLGVAAQMIPQEDLYVALQTGVVDCAIHFGEVATLIGMHEVAPYETYFLPYISAPAAIGISAKSWQKLTPEQQAVLQEAGEYATRATTETAVAYSRDKAAARAARQTKGITITEGFSETDSAELIAAMQSSWQEMATDAGPEAVEVVARVTAVEK